MASNSGVSVELVATVIDYSLIFIEFLHLLLKAAVACLVCLFRIVFPAAPKSVRGEVVLITGAGHGLGKKLAFKFADLGVTLVLWDINQRANNSVAEEIKKRGVTVYAYECDVSNENQVASVGQRVQDEVGDVTILINNAGVLPCQPLLKLTNAQIKRTMDINILGHFWTIRQFLPRMLEINHGHIVSVSSIAGFMGNANMTDYCASKHGVIGLMEALSEELYSLQKAESIHLTTICPVTIDTGLAHSPNTRFPRMLPILKVNETAEAALNAILRNKELVIIPERVVLITLFMSIFPKKVGAMFQHFFGYTTDPNNQELKIGFTHKNGIKPCG